MKLRKSLQQYTIHVGIPFLLGCYLYLIGRPISSFYIGASLKIDNTSILVKLPEWMRYNLPDGLWLYSFLMWLILIWQDEKNIKSIIWYSLLIAIAFGSELLQNYSLIHGTFDRLDILAYFIATTLCIYNYYKFNLTTQ